MPAHEPTRHGTSAHLARDRFRNSVVLVLICGWLALRVATASGAQATSWKLVWNDEFNGPNGSAVDSTKWSFDIGGRGWGNSELETYTDRTVNAHLQDGSLIITALKETLTGPDSIQRDYTSARLV